MHNKEHKPHNKEHKLFTKMSNFSVDDGGIIEGYVTTYGNVDDWGDVIMKGAFDEVDLSNVIMLYSHNYEDVPIGKWGLELKEDGIFGKGIFNLKQQKARDVYEAVKFGTITGLSVGFLACGECLEANDHGGFNIHKVAKLIEVSPCVLPANDKARIERVKNSAQINKNMYNKSSISDFLSARGYTADEISEFENKYNVELSKDIYDAILDKVFEILD